MVMPINPSLSRSFEEHEVQKLGEEILSWKYRPTETYRDWLAGWTGQTDSCMHAHAIIIMTVVYNLKWLTMRNTAPIITAFIFASRSMGTVKTMKMTLHIGMYLFIVCTYVELHTHTHTHTHTKYLKRLDNKNDIHASWSTMTIWTIQGLESMLYCHDSEYRTHG